MSKDLRKLLDIDPMEKETKEVIVVEDHIDSDFEFARTTMYDLIGKSQEALEDMIDVARKSQHPRAYEVLNAMIKTASDMSQNLLDLQKQKQDLTGPVIPTTVNNNLYVGSTTELSKFIESKKKDETK